MCPLPPGFQGAGRGRVLVSGSLGDGDRGQAPPPVHLTHEYEYGCCPCHLHFIHAKWQDKWKECWAGPLDQTSLGLGLGLAVGPGASLFPSLGLKDCPFYKTRSSFFPSWALMESLLCVPTRFLFSWSVLFSWRRWMLIEVNAGRKH